MTPRGVRVLAVVVATTAIAVAFGIFDPGRAPGLTMLGGAIVVGELLYLRPPGRAPVPLSLAIIVVLAGQATFVRFVVIVTLAELAAAVLSSGTARVRATRLAERLCTALIVVGAVSAIDELGRPGSEAAELVAAFAGASAALGFADLWRASTRRARLGQTHLTMLRPSWSGRSADVTIATTAMLMTASTASGTGAGFGLWGLAFCSIPLLMAWYAMERLAAARSTYDQSIETLSVLPEVAGWVPPGRAHRVAYLSVLVGEELGFELWELDRLATAALLHEIGRVSLDDPSAPAPAVVAEAGARILGATNQLAGAGAILEAELHPDTAPVPYAAAGQIIRLVGEFDDSCDGDWPDAPEDSEAVLASIASNHDAVIVGALEVAIASVRTGFGT